MRSFHIVPQAHSCSILAISWPTHHLWKSKCEIRLPAFGCYGLDAHHHTNNSPCTPTNLQTRTHTYTSTAQRSVFELLLLPWDAQTSIHYSAAGMSWLKRLRFLSSSDPIFKAVTSDFNPLNRQIGLHQLLAAKKKDLETVHGASHTLCSLSIKRNCFCIQVSVYE